MTKQNRKPAELVLLFTGLGVRYYVTTESNGRVCTFLVYTPDCITRFVNRLESVLLIVWVSMNKKSVFFLERNPNKIAEILEKLKVNSTFL